MAVVGLNIWTGSPLLALWIGSRLQGSGAPTMGPVFAVICAIAVFSYALARVLMRLSAAHDRLTGHTATVRRHVSWLRSMRGERPQYEGQRVDITAMERMLVVMVVIAFAAFEIWFFFFSASPIDQRTGRAAIERPGVTI
jgi:small neutral amino acid transporter SnatA (MarC family)